MSEEINVQTKLKAVLNWADDHPDFDPSFVESLSDNYDTYEFLSEAQVEALDNIIESFNIDIEEWS